MADNLRLTPLQLLHSLAIDSEEADRRRTPDPGPLEAAFYAHEGRQAHKWVHFLPVYERYLGPYRDTAPKMLEIGVSLGGSLELWRKYFGPEATIFGVDLNPACAQRFDPPNQVRIGSQDDPAFLTSVVKEMGGLDLVLDDGSHIGRHQFASFRTLYPLLRPGGLYMIEDLHTAYWPAWEGGMRKPGTGIELIKMLIDDMHAWYHWEPEQLVRRDRIGAIHMHDSIAIIEKVADHKPGHIHMPVTPGG